MADPDDVAQTRKYLDNCKGLNNGMGLLISQNLADYLAALGLTSGYTVVRRLPKDSEPHKVG